MNKRKTMKKNRKQRGGSSFMNRLGKAVTESLSPTENFTAVVEAEPGVVAEPGVEAEPGVVAEPGVEAARLAAEEAAATSDNSTVTTEDENKDYMEPNSKTFAEVDTDGDGIITGKEFNNMEPNSKTFAEVDTDGDGIITGKEFNNMQEDGGEPMSGGAMKPGKRSFKCSMINKRTCCTGRYISKTPIAAARKYLGVFCRKKGKSKVCKANFDLRETTRGSQKKVYSFKGDRVNLKGKEKKKVMRGDKEIEYSYKYTVQSV